MAESGDPHRDSDFFCPSIVEFLAVADDNGNEDGELDELSRSGCLVLHSVAE